MDATVTDFLNEINQIAPKKDTKQQPDVWQECYDEVTGYSYYWNTASDEVTWTQPKSFKAAENNPRRTSQAKPSYPIPEKKKPELFVPPSAPHYSTASVNPEAKIKIYSIQDTVTKPPKQSNVHTGTSTNKHIPVKKRPPGANDDSDNEKIELITEYGGDSDSEPEEDIREKAVTPVKQVDSQSDEDDDIDLLAKIQQRAKELKKLGGEVPPEVKNIIQKTHIKEKHEKPKVISGFSLVAGYNSASSDSEPEQEEKQEPPPQPVFPVAPPPKPIPETAHSTLFPIPQAIDVKDFIPPGSQDSETTKNSENNPASDFDSKAFQRKRRIGISLVNSAKRPKDDVEREESEFKGFGFKSQTDQLNNGNTEDQHSSSIYPGFQKGGVMFVKSNVLNPPQTSEDTKVLSVVNENSSIDRKETDDIYTVLRQKLLFLGEGRASVLPVQVMLIQAETLFLAMKEGGLKLSYLHKWLQETSSELIKLEKEAAPEGWLLQWDRSHNRYFYQNQATGESQWEYPQPDISRFDEAMDISTTPPPLEIPEPPPVAKPASPVFFGPQLPAEPPLPPSPPKIRSPTPPPPPMISLEPKAIFSDVPLPPEPPPSLPLPPLPPPPKKTLENGEPLPPGVDLPEVAPYNSPKESEIVSDNLSSALDSFYSEIAEATENTNSNSPSSSSQVQDVHIDIPEDFQVQLNVGETVKKKKKKVKLTQGITMKKKGVSQLVEKWKNVQKNYGD